MKQINLFSIAIALIFSATSCDNTTPTITADFEDVTLTDSILNNRSFQSTGIDFKNTYNPEYKSWEGFAASSKTDTKTPTYENQYSPITGKAFSGTTFGVIYQGLETPTLHCYTADADFRSLRITNGTYPYLTMLQGNDFCRKFGAGDWFKLTITGWNGNNTSTGTVEIYLADFRDGKTHILNTWQQIDLSPIATCRTLTFTFTSSDTGEFGINTPAYAIIDDIVYTTK